MAAEAQPDLSRRRFLRWFIGFSAVLAGVALGRGRGSGSSAESAKAATPTSQAVTTTVDTLPPTTVEKTTTSSSPTTSSTSTSTTTTTTPPVALVALCKDSWGAAEVTGEFTSHTIERMTVHHTALLLDDNAAAPAAARRHQSSHIDWGWPDLAYHYLIDANGNIYEGRPVDAVGDTGTDYDPTGHFLVGAEGNFDEQEIPPRQLEALVDVLAWASVEFDVSPTTIRGHRDWAATTCPGDLFYPTIEGGALEVAVRERIAAGGVSLTTLCGDDAAAVVADIETGRV